MMNSVLVIINDENDIKLTTLGVTPVIFERDSASGAGYDGKQMDIVKMYLTSPNPILPNL